LPQDFPAELRSLQPQAQRKLWQRGLLDGAWREQLAQASPLVIDFINRFYASAGFEQVLRAYLGHRLQKNAAVLAISLTQWLGERLPQVNLQLSFQPEIGFVPGGGVFLSICLNLAGRFFLPLPWTELEAGTVQRQYRRDLATFGSPPAFRWVLSGKALNMGKVDVVDRLQNLLAQSQAEAASGGDDIASLVVVI
jgi:hypothetical protein